MMKEPEEVDECGTDTHPKKVNIRSINVYKHVQSSINIKVPSPSRWPGWEGLGTRLAILRNSHVHRIEYLFINAPLAQISIHLVDLQFHHS